ncbi:MAG TPA: response regulator [Candidatus Dormibacteraeota bacterium]|nr:response regulator [Candidatus Dormibacteraeota bacterium]
MLLVSGSRVESARRDISGEYVALVEDDPAIAEMYGFGLRRAGYSVAAFPDGIALLASLDMYLPDMLVLDWMLPGMTADELLSRLREDVRTKDLRVFVLSNLSTANGGEIDVAFSSGVLAWLEKSKTTPDTLAGRVREVLTLTESGAARS